MTKERHMARSRIARRRALMIDDADDDRVPRRFALPLPPCLPLSPPARL
jgi:hypothetical protein